MLRIVKRVFALSGNKKKKLIIAFVMTFFENLCMFIPIGMVLLTLNDIAAGSLTIDIVWRRSGVMVVALILQYIFNLLIYIFQSRTGFEIMGEQRLIIGERLKRLPMGYYSDNNVGNISSIVTNDLSFIEQNSMQFLSKVINAILSTLIVSIFIFTVDWKMAVVALIGFPIAFLLNLKIQKDFKKHAPEKQEKQASVVSNLLEYIQGISIIKAFNLAGSNFKKVDGVLKQFEKISLKFEMKAVPWNAAFNACFQICIALILYFGPYYYLANELSLANMLMFIIIAFRIYLPIEGLSIYSGIVRFMDACLDRLENFLSIELLDEKDIDTKINSYNIEFSDVTFSYKEREILKNISFDIPEKSMTAIVGPSGSGKTTITNLIARFWDVQSGQVLVGGVNVKDVKCDSLLSHISMVFQNVYLFHDTVLNNIKFGNPEAAKGQVMDAARKARCHDFIMALENGYDTVIGEGGSTLSGGEKQRISIARAMLKDAPIVLLDEATSSIDPENEKEIREAFGLLVKNKTLVVIAHRLSTIKNADQILVLNQEGELAERGTHKQLLNKGGIYLNLWEKRQKAENWKVATGK